MVFQGIKALFFIQLYKKFDLTVLHRLLLLTMITEMSSTNITTPSTNSTSSPRINLIPKPNKDNNEITMVEVDYLSNTVYDEHWVETTRKILNKLYPKVHIHQFLKIVFSNQKPQIFITQDKEFAERCLNSASTDIRKLFDYFLFNAPKKVLDIYRSSSFNEDIIAQANVYNYIANTFKSHELFNVLDKLFHYNTLLRLMCNK